MALPEVPKIALVTDKHDQYILISVIAEFAQPSLDVLVGQMLGYVVDEQRAHRTAVVRRRDRAVPLLPGRIPYLGFYGFTVHLGTI